LPYFKFDFISFFAIISQTMAVHELTDLFGVRAPEIGVSCASSFSFIASSLLLSMSRALKIRATFPDL